MSALQSYSRLLIAAASLLLLGAVSGCAHQNTRDPLEPMNRGIYTFNDALDRAILKPVATGYRQILPQTVRRGISNFFSNLNDLTVVVNDLLQGKIPQAMSDAGRFLINTTLGILGFMDVATELGVEKHNEDFGQTLGYWGIGSGPYLVLPFFGPSSFRDGIGRLVDRHTDVVMELDHIRTRNQLWGTRIVSDREGLLDSEKLLDTAAIDRYSFIRDAYLQRRRNLVYDGNPPPELEDDEPSQKQKPQSRSFQDPAMVSTLVDQYGAVVANGNSEGTPALETASPRATGSTAAPVRAEPDRTDADHSSKAMEVPSGVPASSVSGEPPASFVRVWLPGSARP